MKAKSKSQVVLEELTPFLGAFFDRFMADKDTPPEVHPVRVMAEMALEYPPSRVAQGLLMAVNDCLEMASYMRPEERHAFDVELTARNIITLTELRRRHSKRYARILERGKINRLPDYYLVRSVVSDGHLASGKREKLERLLEAYEATHPETPKEPPPL